VKNKFHGRNGSGASFARRVQHFSTKSVEIGTRTMYECVLPATDVLKGREYLAREKSVSLSYESASAIFLPEFLTGHMIFFNCGES
jgi:hypothetical protein